jgi:hypothetical protein
MTLSRTYFTPLPIKRIRHLKAVAPSTEPARSLPGELAQPDAPMSTTRSASRAADLTIAAGLLRRKLTGRERVDIQNEDALDLALEDTFPASDPVSVTFGPDAPTYPILKRKP